MRQKLVRCPTTRIPLNVPAAVSPTQARTAYCNAATSLSPTMLCG